MSTVATESAISPQDLMELQQRTAPPTILDVRTAGEFDTSHIAGAHHAPLALIEGHAAAIADELKQDAPTVLMCQSGQRAEQASRKLAAAGAENLRVLTGGVSDYHTAGGTIVHGQPRWSMERQVRLVAGSVVLAATLASLRAPKIGLVAGGIGAGLTFSALTDTCAMARVLSLLPYNRGHNPQNLQRLRAALH